nr:transposase, MuDR, MULE transposase domain protein [Tanacetum cinerariifolium]
MVDLLKHTNFFRAFTASSTIPSIYIQQFWDTIQYDKTIGCYRCQLDEQWFVLTKDTLREALHITPVNNNQAFVPLLSSDALINFVNELGCPKEKEGHSDCDPKYPVHQADYPSPLEEFSAKGTKREVFGMPIPGSLITTDIQEASYYQKYLANVAKHRRYLAGETGSDPDSPAPKPTKLARKPKSTAPKAPPRPSVSTPVTSAQPGPPSGPIKPQRKKPKLTTETSDKPSKDKKSKYGFVSKKRTLKSVAESVAEDSPAKEPQVGAEDADMQKALEESLKSMYDVPRGPLPPVVIREPESGKYQSLPEVPGKGKAKLSSSTRVEPSTSTLNPVRIIPGPADFVARLLKEKGFILVPDGVLMSTQQYMDKVVEDVGEDDDFKSAAWLSATNYVNAFCGIVIGCLGDVNNFLKKGKLKQVVRIVKSCLPNMLGGLNVTLKDLSGIIPETIHHKVISEGDYEKDIDVGDDMILKNVSVFTPKPSKHYLNITMRNVVEVFRKDIVP